MKVSQIVSAVDIAHRYRAKISNCKNVLQWELMQSGETEKAEWLRKEIKENEDALKKHLDVEV